jgi:hypothetical protein
VAMVPRLRVRVVAGRCTVLVGLAVCCEGERVEVSAALPRPGRPRRRVNGRAMV